MINPIAAKIYAASAAGIEQVVPHQRVQPISSVQHHENTSPKSLREESVKVSISSEAINYLALLKGDKSPIEKATKNYTNDYGKQLKKRKGSKHSPQESEGSNTNKLESHEEEEVKELQKRDQEVKTHEQQHAAIGGSYVRGGPNYEYQQGPDGQRYAVGGHVDIDTGKESTPEATIRKAQVIKAAATAPGEPSSTDLSVAAQATSMQIEAQMELSEKLTNDNTTEDKKELQNDNTTEEAAQPTRPQGITKALKAYQNSAA